MNLAILDLNGSEFQQFSRANDLVWVGVLNSKWQFQLEGSKGGGFGGLGLDKYIVGWFDRKLARWWSGLNPMMRRDVMS
jgi:hypothetical protein